MLPPEQTHRLPDTEKLALNDPLLCIFISRKRMNGHQQTKIA
jgi:hypothetical protein